MSLEWFRQGKTVEETATLTKNAIMMSKLANMDSAQSTEYLTSIINGFKLNAEDVTGVIDKLVSVDNSAATSVEELATALQRTSNVAQQAGVSFDEVTAYIGVVSSVTRKSASSIGESFKTMFTRMGDIRTGALDEEGMGINQVEDALKRIGIQLRDSDTSFRDFSDVIGDVAKKWDTLNEIEQANIAKAIAGTRQRDIFLTLMRNYNEAADGRISVEKLLEEQLNATGLAEQRYGIFLDNLESAQNRAKASWEAMWEATIKSDAIKYFYNLSAQILDLITNMGGLQTAIVALAGVFVLINVSSIANVLSQMTGYLQLARIGFQVLTMQIQAGMGAQLAFNAVASVNPYVWVILAVVVLGGLIWKLNDLVDVSKRAAEANEKVKNSFDNIASLRGEYNEIKKLADSYELLSKKKDKTEEESQRLLDIQNRLKELMPELNGSYDVYGNFLLSSTANMEDLTAATQAQITEALKLAKINAENSGEANAANLSSKFRELQESQQGYKMQRGVKVSVDSSPEEKARLLKEYQDALNQAKASFGLMGKESQDAFIASFNGSELAKIFVDIQIQAKEDLDKRMLESYQKQKNREQEAPTLSTPVYSDKPYEGVIDTIKTLSDSFSTLDGLIQKSIEGTLEFGDLANVPAEYADSIEIVNGKYQLNIDKIKEAQIETLQLGIDAAKLAGDSQGVDILTAQLQRLQEEASRTHGQFQLTAWDYENLIWQIANQSAAAGDKVFFDMQGNALNSAQAIFDFMKSSDANFMSIVSQYAKVLGISVSQAMQMVQGYVNSVYIDGVNKINSLAQAINMGISSSSAPYAMQWGKGKPLAGGGLTPLPTLPSGIGGGGSGGGSSDKQSKAEERQKKIADEIEKERKKAVDNLKKQLDLYKDIIDARKDILDTMASERKYQQDVEERQANILKIQNELAALQYDNTAEAQARRLQLQDELIKQQKELENVQYDQSVEVQKKALDAQYQDFAKKMNDAISMIEGIEASSVKDFTNKLAAILSGLATAPAPAFHTGAEKGLVGGTKSQTGEIFAKLMSGELVSNAQQMDTFMRKTLPSLMGTPSGMASGGGFNVEKLFDLVVNGNLDSSVIPDIERISEKVVDRINKSLLSRGIIRNTNLTRI